MRSDQAHGCSELRVCRADARQAFCVSSRVVRTSSGAPRAVQRRELRRADPPVAALLPRHDMEMEMRVSCPLKIPLFWHVRMPCGRYAASSATASLRAETKAAAHSSSESSSTVATCRRVITQHWPVSNCRGLITARTRSLWPMISHRSSRTARHRSHGSRTGRLDQATSPGWPSASGRGVPGPRLSRRAGAWRLRLARRWNRSATLPASIRLRQRREGNRCDSAARHRARRRQCGYPSMRRHLRGAGASCPATAGHAGRPDTRAQVFAARLLARVARLRVAGALPPVASGLVPGTLAAMKSRTFG